MTTARKEIVDPQVTRLYHCISKCVRGGFLLGQGGWPSISLAEGLTPFKTHS